MLFQELRELEKLLDKYNERIAGEKAEFWFPHMYSDGKWSVTIVFNQNPILYEMSEMLASCYYHNLYAFFGQLNGDIALFIQ